ncbi:MAG: DUF3592 domain-containing protein [Planctomycetes bacterium]|jgi:hypothetical protein|nr:DUF3592 domain-containing protein [Planctomycetota bacterium]
MEQSTLVLLAIGAALAVVLPWQLQGVIRKVARQRARANGTVVDVEHHSSSSAADSHSSGTFHAVVTFEVGGRPYRFCSDHGSSLHRPQRGSRVTVRFDPLDPDNAEVERGQSIVLARVMQIGSVVAGVALVLATLL